MAAAGVWSLHRYPDWREGLTLVIAVITLLLVLQCYQPALQGEVLRVTLFEMLPGLDLRFELEPLGMLFALLVSTLWIISTLYSIGYMRGNRELHQTRFYCFFALAVSCTLGIALAGNLLTLFVFYEGLTLSTYPLVTHRQDDQARSAGRVYLGFLLFSSIVLLLPAIIACYSMTGSSDFITGGLLADKIAPGYILPLLLLFAWGIGKAALMPIHLWLPRAMVAPAPVSALLHAVAVVKAGVFTVTKVVIYVFGIDTLHSLGNTNIVLYIAGVTIILSSLVALRSDNLKHMLAYSTISQLSYVILAAVLLSPISIIAAAMHIMAHALGKITLFFAAGAIYLFQRQNSYQRVRWYRMAYAVDHAGICHRWFVDDWLASDSRFCQ